MDLSLDLDALDFARGGGTVSVVAQDASTGAVLMVAAADREALERTLATREMHYRSRTRGLWHKGATSGNVQRVLSLTVDCDRDAVLALVRPAGPVCHTGAATCFAAFQHEDALQRLDRIIAKRAIASAADATADANSDATADAATETPSRGSYTRKLLGDRNLRLKKLGEECAELVTACADGDRSRAIEEAADLCYHMMVALRSLGAGVADVQRALDARHADRVKPGAPAGQ